MFVWVYIITLQPPMDSCQLCKASKVCVNMPIAVEYTDPRIIMLRTAHYNGRVIHVMLILINHQSLAFCLSHFHFFNQTWWDRESIVVPSIM